MAVRKHSFIEGEFYHIYTHSVGDMILFKTNRDYIRAVNTLFASNSTRDIPRLDRFADLNLVWDMKDGKIDIGENLVDLVGFCFMPNHFHLLIGEKRSGNISLFMHRLLVSYSKYFNLKYERRGHVFERTFNSKHLIDNEYLLRASAYIHLNSKDLDNWQKKECQYPWSSFQDYAGENRWGRLLKAKIVLDQFDGHKQDYRRFAEDARNIDYDPILT